MTLKELKQFRNGSLKVTRLIFREALKKSIGANADYADGCFRDFQDAPCHYICSRTDPAQSQELLDLCMKLGQETP